MTDDEKKPPFTDILRRAGHEKFAEIFSASSRKARETYLHRHGVRAAAPTSRIQRVGAKTEARVAALFEILARDDDDEMAEELLRTWLLTKRPMLAAALDHLGISHTQGLTDSDDLKRFTKLSKREIRALVEIITPHGSRQDAALYLEYMGAEDVADALS